jgi:subtilisin family serine protease
MILSMLFACGVSEEVKPERYIIRPANSIKANRRFMNALESTFQVHKKLEYEAGYVVYAEPEKIEQAKGNLSFMKIEKDIVYKIDTGCDRDAPPLPEPPPPVQPAQMPDWGYKEVRADLANEIDKGKGIIVCVADTGVDKDHVDLVDNLIGGQDFTGKGDYDDGNGHGSHVAGIISAVDNTIGIIGIAPEASIYSVKVLDDLGSGYGSDISQGIRACMNQGAKVINLSLGSTEPSDIIHEAIIDAFNAGIKVVCAAGNDSSEVNYPAKFEECIAISAINDRRRLASFSSRGSQIEYAAPGVLINSTTPNDNYAEFSGTSMATPIVSGVFALMFSAKKDRVNTLDLGLASYEQGNGLIDALGTVND